MKKIEFRPISKEVELLVEPPKPAKLYMPDWYKKAPRFYNNNLKIDDFGSSNATMKMCLPFMDSFTTGYIQETWCDIQINISHDKFEYRYADKPEIINVRKEKSHYPEVSGFLDQEFVWQQTWIPKLPDGYSMIYTHPFNRYDLPFLSLTGIIDNDKYFMENLANHPFIVKENFSGIIPKGTPMFQMIPMKRDSWVSESLKWDQDLSVSVRKVRQYFHGGYKKLFWQKKDFS